jgi:hypothetical protein
MSAISRAYRTDDAASRVVAALKAIGVKPDRIRVIRGEGLRDVREEQVGEFAGTVGPDAPVGSFGDEPHRRSEPKGDFASTGGAGRVGTFADADRDTVTDYPDGVPRMHVTGDHDVESILMDAGVDAETAKRDVRALHEGSALVLVLQPSDAEGVRRAMDDAG